MANFLYTLVIYPLHTIIECIYTLFNRLIDSPGACVIGVSAGVSLLCLPLYAVAERGGQTRCSPSARSPSTSSR